MRREKIVRKLKENGIYYVIQKTGKMNEMGKISHINVRSISIIVHFSPVTFSCMSAD